MSRRKQQWVGEISGPIRAAERIGRIEVEVRLDHDPDRPVVLRLPASWVPRTIDKLQRAYDEALLKKEAHRSQSRDLRDKIVGRAQVPTQGEARDANNHVTALHSRDDAKMRLERSIQAG